jgi:hypothetical protein
MPHIVSDIENTKGNDYIITDIHGELTLLRSFVENILTPHDRLFIAGDLVDRGENSLGVLQYIQEKYFKRIEQNLPPQIISIRGNHEDLLYNYILTRLYPNDYTEEVCANAKKVYFGNSGEWAGDVSDTQLASQLDFLESLPYIIHIQGKRAFHIVHADMPISDTHLEIKLDSHNTQLSKEQTHYAIWARGLTILPYIKGMRDENSIPAYCGHNILGGVRLDTNHINADIGCYYYHHLCVINHTKATCEIFAKNKFLNDPEIPKDILKIKTQINHHLDFRSKIFNLLQPLLYECINKTKVLSIHNHRLNQIRVTLFNDAIKEITIAATPESAEQAIIKLLTRNISAVKTSARINKNFYGTLHTKIISEYPHLADEVVRKFNALRGEQITKEKILSDVPTIQLTKYTP